jgi:hypothetical protein
MHLTRTGKLFRMSEPMVHSRREILLDVRRVCDVQGRGSAEQTMLTVRTSIFPPIRSRLALIGHYLPDKRRTNVSFFAGPEMTCHERRGLVGRDRLGRR